MTRDVRLASREDSVLRYLLDKWAARTPTKIFVVFGSGERWTYADFRLKVRQRAAGLRAMGVTQSDHVLVWLPNGPQGLVTWFAINYLGAVYVPINTAYRGGVLEHVIAVSDAKLGIVHADLAERLAPIKLSQLSTIVALQGTAPLPALPGVTFIGADKLDVPIGEDEAAQAVLALSRPIEPWDTQCIIYTSGTTGPSKGVMSSYLHLLASGQGFPLATADDRHMVTLPLFHAGGTIPIYLMLSRNGSITLVESFNTDRFWSTVRDTQTTTLVLLGVMAGFLMKRPVDKESENSPLRWVTALPLDDDAIQFGKRHSVDIITVFNMTEVSCPLVSTINPTQLGSCGHPREGVSARLVDANDAEVETGQVGELIVRTDAPWAMNHGYYKNPAATAQAWRNGWFHTGDAFRRNAQGDYFFVDRMKDAIRRRGENISSFEVESEVIAHPKVREAAAVAVPSELSEDEVLVAVSLGEGERLDPIELVDFLRGRMAHFMVPRYIRIMSELPKTPTQKVQKHVIRAQGVTPDTWDREAAGVVVKREKLGR